MEPAYARMSVRRILALAVAVGCHGVVLMALLMPATPSDTLTAMTQMHDAQIKVRWIPPRQLIAPAPVPVAVPSLASAPGVGTKSSPLHAMKQEARPTTSEVTRDTSPPLVLPNMLALPGRPSVASGMVADAGFHDRVHDAQHSRDVHGIPGSDRRIVRGITLIDPRKQGIGSVMRNVQRLFGVTQRACMDVDALQQLSPEELIARHLTQEDLDKQAEKYQCNEPLGQHF